ncbi:MAG: hypothetical protein E7262_10330 [Lachnospiraceae bacterium]|nr:hypothetical protein [Lachnospiraceae bacterium]
MLDRLPIRKIKNVVAAIIIIVLAMYMLSTYTSVFDDIAKQQMANHKSEVLEFGGYYNQKEVEGGSEHSFEGKVEVEEQQDEEVEEKEFIEIKVSILRYIKFGFICLALSLVVVFMFVSKGQEYAFLETFESTLRKVLLIVPTILVTAGITSVFVIYINNYVKEVNELNKKQIEAEAKIKIDGVHKLEGGDKDNFKGTYKSVVSDQSVFIAGHKSKIVVEEAIVDKSGIDCFDNSISRNYGVNAAVLAVEKGRIEVKSSNIYADSKGATGVFATGNNALVFVKNSKLQILGRESAYGLAATYNGKVEATGIDVVTGGEECAAVYSGRSGGDVDVNDSYIKTYGARSPIAYAKGNVVLNKSEGESKRSNILMIEDDGSIQLENCNFLGGLGGYNAGEDEALVYMYSNSSDEKKDASIVTINDSLLETAYNSDHFKTAPAFIIANTKANINLCNTRLIYGSRIAFDIKAIRSLGASGQNGGHATIKTEKQNLIGFVKVDEDSTLELNMTEGTAFIGGINYLNSGSEKVEVKLDQSSRMMLTSHCFLTKFENEDTTNSNINFGRFKIFVKGKPIN